MSDNDIQERLGRVCVYAVGKSLDDLVVGRDKNRVRSLSLMCVNKENDETILEKQNSMNSRVSLGNKLVPVALSEVLPLMADEIPVSLTPESLQMKYAIETHGWRGWQLLWCSHFPVKELGHVDRRQKIHTFFSDWRTFTNTWQKLLMSQGFYVLVSRWIILRLLLLRIYYIE